VIDLKRIPNDKPVLIAGPTASGKSALALEIAQAQGGIIVNADALQVFDRWRILTARPSQAEEDLALHALYGHLPYDADYSVGHWLRDVAPFLNSDTRPIIVGGTGLYFSALTEGLAEIPATPPQLRLEADQIALDDLITGLDEQTKARIDLKNRARVQRAWEVLHSTKRSLADWQDDTPPPLLPLECATSITLMPEKEWLNDRIERRFDLMLEAGALDEARAMLPDWNPTHLSSKAIGAPELIAHLNAQITLDQAREKSIIASRQYAKRQRTWFRARMKNWQIMHSISTDL